MSKKEVRILEKINPLARLRRRREEKSEREWRIARLGRICPACAVPLEVSFKVSGNVVVTSLKCPKCWRGWGHAELIKGAGGRPGGEVDVGRIAGLRDQVLGWFEQNTRPHEAALVARLLADMLEGVYGAPVDPETYERLAKLLAGPRVGAGQVDRRQERGGRSKEPGEPEAMYA